MKNINKHVAQNNIKIKILKWYFNWKPSRKNKIST